MRRLFGPLLIAACLLGTLTTTALAAGPSTMSYQGVLTDGGGNLVVDGAYSITFRIYDLSAGGVALWSEVKPAVQVTKGGFSVVLGSTAPIDLPFSVQYYLGVQVGAGPELTPRISLASSPYAMSVWMLGDGGLRAGELSVNPTLGDGGGYVHLYNSLDGGFAAFLEPDANGDAFFAYFDGAGSSSMTWDGNFSGSGRLALGGQYPSQFFTGQSGDASVSLPTDAISSIEMLDEPGIAQGHSNGLENILTGGTMADIVTVSITIPSAGYIVVEADGQHGMAGNGVDRNTADIQIDETPGGITDANHYFISGYNPTSSQFSWNPVSVRRVYQKAAGTYTFRLEARGNNPAGLSNYLWNPTITATFYPTAYGTVTTAPDEAELAQFEDVRRTTSGPNGPDGSASVGALVDLRELELRVRREQAQLAEAERQLNLAQQAQQVQASARAVAARGGADESAPKGER